MSQQGISRRTFVSSLAGSAFAFTIVPRHVLGGPGYIAPSDKVNLGLIGAGARGMQVAQELIAGGQNIAAIADIDLDFVDRSAAAWARNPDGSVNPARAPLQEQYARAKRYVDFREMLERERNNIDGVLVITPDHGHAVQAMAAMQLGKPVYVEKPLTWSVYEARVLAATAARTGVVTQMGNQGHSSDGNFRVAEWLQAGVLGPIREVHTWTNRPIWPQGIPRPTRQALRPQTANPSVTATGGGAAGAPPQLSWENVRNIQQPMALAMAGDYPVPEGVNWDLFIGPAPMVPYHPLYHPFNWRGWYDWGVGALGDMGAHIIDQPQWALDLGLPTSISATSTPFGMDVGRTPASWPQAMTVHYDFPARGNRPPVKLVWYDGGLMPGHPDVLPPEVVLERGGGVLYVGDRGVLITRQHGSEPHLFYPESLRAEAERVPQRYERIPHGHYLNFAHAIMGRAKPSSAFEYAAVLTETMLLGLVALQTGQGRTILYDAENMNITNIPEANYLLHREYREGWSL
jgi:predicted dehydrogenase